MQGVRQDSPCDRGQHVRPHRWGLQQQPQGRFQLPVPMRPLSQQEDGRGRWWVGQSEETNVSKIIRVVPPPAGEYGEGYPTRCFGTKVYVGDEAISVQKITLIAEPRNVWRAIIETTVQVDGEIAAVVRDQDQATPAPMGSQCGDEPSKPRNWIGRFIGWVTGRGATRTTTSAVMHMVKLPTPGDAKEIAKRVLTRAWTERAQRSTPHVAATHIPDHDREINTLALAVMRLTRAMADQDQRQAVHVAAGQSLTCTADIERQAKEACDSLVEALNAEQARDELSRSQIVQDASIEAEQADERSRS